MATSSGSKTTMTASAAVSAYAANPKMAAVAIADTTANIGTWLDSLQTLAAAGKILSVTLTDSGKTMTITANQLVADAKIIAFLPVQQLFIVTGTRAAEADAVQANARVKSFQISDTAANVSTWLDALNNDTKLTAVTLTTSDPIVMTYRQYQSDTAILAKLPSTARYAVSDVTVSGASSVQSNAKVSTFGVTDTAGKVVSAAASLASMGKLAAVTVNDTAAAVLANLSALGGIAKVTTINVTDTSLLAVTFQQYQESAAALAKLAPAEKLTVSAVTAAAAASVAEDPRVASLGVSDTLANIGARLASLDALAETGRLSAIAVTDTGQTLTLTEAERVQYQEALALLQGSFTIATAEPPPPPTLPPLTKAPVINLIWDPSTDGAPEAFRFAVQYAARFFDELITSPITVNIRVGWGDARGVTLAPGLLGEAYVTTGVFRSYTQYKADLAAHNTSATIQTAIDTLANPGRQIFVPGAQAKALGAMDPNASLADGAIGFAIDTTGSLYTYDSNNRAVAGKVDLIGLVQHEITHALGRVSYSWGTTGFDLYRYSAPGVWATSAAGATYLSLDGGATSLGAFSLTGDVADWGPSMANDVQAAFLGTGIQFTYSDADIAALNALGYAIRTEPASTGSSGGDGTVISPTAGSSAAHMAFLEPAEAPAPTPEPAAAPWTGAMRDVASVIRTILDRHGITAPLWQNGADDPGPGLGLGLADWQTVLHAVAVEPQHA